MFLWSIALQYLIYASCILLIEHQIKQKYLFVSVILLCCVVLGFLYPLFGIFTALIAISMLMLTFFFFSSSRQKLIYALPWGLLTSLLGDHLTSFSDFFILKNTVIEPGDSLQYLHLIVSATLSALLALSFKKALNNFHGLDRRMIGTIGTLMLFTYYVIIFYTRFSGETSKILSLNTGFFILYLLGGLFILIYYWKISKKKMADQLLEQRMQLQQDYIRDLEKNYQDLREFKHDYQNLLFSMNSYLVEEDLEGLRQYYNQNILPTHQIMEQFPVNLSLLDQIKNPEIKSLLSLKLMMAQEKGLSIQLLVPEEIRLKKKYTVNLVRMLGIILDNAIEGASITKKKKIELLILKKKHFIIIRVTNTTLNTLPLNKLKQKGFSTKTGPKNEGLGLFILDELTKSNPYIFLETSIENQRFSQSLYIKTE
ncbi:sensor histidine kinase [Enterococcus villorum]|uniref:Histidine kinase n=1 Tax=Enterococcus villorum TaxID=112904 RepID=A0A511J4A8_9ENTE|nr:sensor histidine kinase [Enterococcus villorum]GEL92825.1 histidine kinase [Enterococcus villorum]